MPQQFKVRFFVVIIFAVAVAAAFFDAPYLSNLPHVPGFFKKEYKLGLDLKGGAHLIFDADLSKTEDKKGAMDSLRDAIERRVNLFGVSEPLVQIETKNDIYRLVVELAGVDAKEAIRIIGQTPFLDFQELNGPVPKTEEEGKNIHFIPTGLDGKYLKHADVVFDNTTGRPEISVTFNDDGARLFGDITKRNIQKPLGIFLDGAMLSSPTVQEEITGGKAQITGQFDLKNAKDLVLLLNAGALPVPISLISQQTVEASLGKVYLEKSLKAGFYGILVVMIFMVLWYRLPGVIAVIALLIYSVFTLAFYKLLNITLTTAGIAGFILSIGMAVDANILVFERMKEELRAGRAVREAMLEGFRRAWTSIRDSNVSSLITSAVLYSFGTSIVKGFALTLSIGILISMFTALTVTRGLLLSILTPKIERARLIFLTGFGR